MDDFLVFASSKQRAWALHQEIDHYVQSKLGLKLKSALTSVVPISSGVQFLGVRVWPYRIRLDQARVRRLIRRIHALHKIYRSGQMTDEELRRKSEGIHQWVNVAQTRSLKNSLWASRWELDH